MAGMNNQTGAVLDGWDHVVQSVYDIFTKRFFEQRMRPYVGSHVIRILGENATEQTIMRFQWAVCMAIDLFEPRLTPKRVACLDFDRTGWSAWAIEVVYRPRALEGDYTPAGVRTLVFDPTVLKQAIVTALPEEVA